MRRSRQAVIADLARSMQAYQRSTQAFDDEVGRVLGVNPVDLRCLDWLSESPLSPSRLARATGLSASATTSMIDRLERKGLVRRVPHQTDRRRTIVEMTEQGREASWRLYGSLVEAGIPLLAPFDTTVLASMAEYLRTLRELTDAGRERLREMPAG
jgi:DNA-binding MarR family transcriptional regulator